MHPYTKLFTGTTDWEPLSAVYLGFSGSLGALPTNGSALEVRIGSDVTTQITLIPGEFWPIDACDISSIQIKGNGLVLTAVGVTSLGW